jgi:hypothetical protein
MTLQWVVDRVVENVLHRLEATSLPSPAYALALQAVDTEFLYASEISIGLELDRKHVMASVPVERAFFQVWNAWDFPLGGAREPQLALDSDFVEVQDAVREELEVEGGEEAARHVLKLAARRLAVDPPIRPTTDDFVVYAFDDRFDEGLVEDIRFSGSPQALAILTSKGLLPSRRWQSGRGD